MKKLFKLSSILVIMMVVMLLFSNIAMAAGTDWTSSINSLAESTGYTDTNSTAQGIVGAIISIVRIVAVGIAIIMLAVLAMKYMMAAPGDKADIKKHAVVYVVGAVVLFASSGILGIIANFASNISDS